MAQQNHDRRWPAERRRQARPEHRRGRARHRPRQVHRRHRPARHARRRACSAARTRTRASSASTRARPRRFRACAPSITYKDAPKVMIWGSRQYRPERSRPLPRRGGGGARRRRRGDRREGDEAHCGRSTSRCRSCSIPKRRSSPARRSCFEDGNLEGQPRMLTRGDVEQGLKESDKVIERVLPLPDDVERRDGAARVRGAVGRGSPDALGVDAGARSACTAASRRCSTCPIANVRVIASYVGGGFGTKSAPHTDEALAAMLARKARLPVKLQYTREEEILDSNTRFETKMYVQGRRQEGHDAARTGREGVHQPGRVPHAARWARQPGHAHLQVAQRPHRAVPRPHQRSEHRPDARRRRPAGDVRHRIGDGRESPSRWDGIRWSSG